MGVSYTREFVLTSHGTEAPRGILCLVLAEQLRSTNTDEKHENNKKNEKFRKKPLEKKLKELDLPSQENKNFKWDAVSWYIQDH